MINNINFEKGKGGLSRPLAGKDHYSGICFYEAGATGSYQTIFSPDELTISSDADLVTAVEDFFRYNDKGVLYVGAFGITASYDFEELKDLQNYAEGEIRQALILNTDTDVDGTNVSAIQAVCTDLEETYRPLSTIFTGDYSLYADMTEIPDMLTEGQYNVSVCVSKDVNKNIDAGAALLGCISRAKVSTNVGWVEQFNLTEGSHYSQIELVTGEQLSSLTESAQGALNNKGLISIRDFVDYQGVYFMDSYTLDLGNSDYHYIENVRTIDKSIRQARVILLPDLNRPLLVNDDGTIPEDLISYFTGKINNVLQIMVNNEELSAYRVTINPLQNVLSTSELNVSMSLVPVGVARKINVKVGFAVNV